MARKRKVPSIYSVSMADCFAGVVAAILVCSFLQEVVVSRQRSQLLANNNVILQIEAVGLGPADESGRRPEYPVPVAIQLWLPDAGGGTGRRGLTSGRAEAASAIPRRPFSVPPEHLRRYRLYGRGGGPPRNFCSQFLPPRQAAPVARLAFQNVDDRIYPRCVLVVRPYQLPAEPVEQLRLRGSLVDPVHGHKLLGDVVRRSMEGGWLANAGIRLGGSEVQIDVAKTMTEARLFLRADVSRMK